MTSHEGRERLLANSNNSWMDEEGPTSVSEFAELYDNKLTSDQTRHRDSHGERPETF